jgi:hypothetical protein
MNKDPMQEWVLRDELLSTFHRWPQILAFILGGILLGIAVSYIMTPVYRASTQISVELNPYRVLDDRYVPEFAGAEFRNIDDYKHWQMSQLSILVSSDPYLSETLNRLTGIDPYWESVQVAELRDMLEVNWRNAGRWLLNADAERADLASQALETWQDVILEKTGLATGESRQLFELELALRSLNDQLVAAQSCLPILQRANLVLEVFADHLQEGDLQEMPGSGDREELFSTVLGIKDCGSGWQSILDQFPAEGSSAVDYADWIDLVAAAIQAESSSLELTIDHLNEEISSVDSDWQAALQGGQGLSATLVLKKVGQDVQDVKQIRSTSLTALVGGLLGLLAWFLLFLFKITRRAYRR